MYTFAVLLAIASSPLCQDEDRTCRLDWRSVNTEKQKGPNSKLSLDAVNMESALLTNAKLQLHNLIHAELVLMLRINYVIEVRTGFWPAFCRFLILRMIAFFISYHKKAQHFKASIIFKQTRIFLVQFTKASFLSHTDYIIPRTNNEFMRPS